MSADLAPWEIDTSGPFCGCKPVHTPGGCPVEPFPFERKPMQQDDYDALRDDIQAAYLKDHSRLTEFLDAALSCLGIIAQTAAEADNVLAADCLEQMGLHAKSGVPMNERSVDL